MSMQTMGVFSPLISRRFTAMASATPRSSLPTPGYAPGVSMRVTTGRRTFSASFITRRALR